MKTHELSRLLNHLNPRIGQLDEGDATELTRLSNALQALATLLLQGPNLPLSEVRITKNTDDIAVGIKVLLSLSNYSKQQWLALATEYHMPIEFNPRDSARDALGKVLRYLEAHPETVRSLGTRPKRTKVDTSELENALTKLLERKND
jgi:hypothetical protein